MNPGGPSRHGAGRGDTRNLGDSAGGHLAGVGDSARGLPYKRAGG